MIQYVESLVKTVLLRRCDTVTSSHSVVSIKNSAHIQAS